MRECFDIYSFISRILGSSMDSSIRRVRNVSVLGSCEAETMVFGSLEPNVTRGGQLWGRASASLRTWMGGLSENEFRH